MRILLGILSLGAGVALCAPAAILAWVVFSTTRANRTVFITSARVSFGGLTLSGWQASAFVGGLTVLGIALIACGGFLLTSRDSE